MNRAMLAALLGAALVTGLVAWPAAGPVAADPGGSAAAAPAGAVLPPSLAAARPLPAPPVWTSPTVDRAAALAEDAGREAAGLPYRFAMGETVSLTPADAGEWRELPDGRLLWRLAVVSEGALSLNFGFTRFRLPEGAALHVWSAGWDGRAPASGRAYRFTAADNEVHGQLWTPILLGPRAVIELEVPSGARDLVELTLGSINAGYRAFGEPDGGDVLQKREGNCYLDVACPQADPWRTVVRSVAAISFGGQKLCTGFMVNNTAEDQRPYFMTANHCLSNPLDAPSLVVYWGYESPECGTGAPGPEYKVQTGAIFRATWADQTTAPGSDFTLVELDDNPDPAWGVTFAGWNRGAEPPTSSACIHHPDGTEKRISFDLDPASVTSYSFEASPGNGTHLRVADWDIGSTEGGSSGSPLFDQNHRVVGQLHGGFALCGNDLADWFGRFAASWNGNGTSASRLRDWLDPLGTNAAVLDALDPYATVRVLPEGDLLATGPLGGPFAPATATLTVQNFGDAPLALQVTTDAPWLLVGNGSPTVPVGATATITLSLAPEALELPEGVHVAAIRLDAAGLDQVLRRLRLTIGAEHQLLSWPLDDDPGWVTQGAWAFGRPTAQPVEYGDPDPSAGHTGQYVYGYNLNGGYTSNLPPTHLTTPPIDFSAYDRVTLRFWRWLGVESATYDHAAVSVSTDGTTWHEVWANPVQDLSDGRWVAQEIDISTFADRQPAVRLRWTMGPTDASWTFCGWNLDDVQLWGLDRNRFPSDGETGRTALLAVVPNPFLPGLAPLRIDFELRAAGRARLRVYDLRGRLVRTLLDGPADFGPHSREWNGLDDAGRRLPGGVYVVRFEADGVTQGRKATLLR